MYKKVQESLKATTCACKDAVEKLNDEERKRLVIFGRFSFSVLKRKGVLIGYKQKFDKNL